MKEFILAALPFVVTGVSIAVIVINNKSKKEETYISEGMCLGMCFGVSFGCMFTNNLGLFLSLGMLIGEAIGNCIKKNKKEE